METVGSSASRLVNSSLRRRCGHTSPLRYVMHSVVYTSSSLPPTCCTVFGFFSSLAAPCPPPLSFPTLSHCLPLCFDVGRVVPCLTIVSLRLCDQAKDLIQSLLRVDATQRPSAGQCLRHPWITGVTSAGLSASSMVLLSPGEQHRRWLNVGRGASVGQGQGHTAAIVDCAARALTCTDPCRACALGLDSQHCRRRHRRTTRG
jgi:hypothetical protein